VGVPLPPGKNHTCALALDALHKAVLKSLTLEELKEKILAATAGCDVGLHYCGDENQWTFKSVSYKGSMVDLGQVILLFFLPLRKFVEDCELSQLISCLVMQGKWRIPH
jgi:hypothetical protein